MNRPDEHLRQAGQIAELLTHPSDDPLFEFGGSLVGERERDDVAWLEAAPSGLEQMNDRRATTSVFPEPAQAMSWRLAKPKPMAFCCDAVNFINAPGPPFSSIFKRAAS